MMTPAIFSQAAHLFRAVTFLPSGQRFEGWLPDGTYTIVGDVNLSLGRGSTETARATQLERPLKGAPKGCIERWYVGADLLRKHLDGGVA